jgi:hypothetical protein
MTMVDAINPADNVVVNFKVTWVTNQYVSTGEFCDALTSF